jgi:hypothetical protein
MAVVLQPLLEQTDMRRAADAVRAFEDDQLALELL